MDEWWGLTIQDIRAIEKETQEILARKYAVPAGGEEERAPSPGAPQPSSQAASNDRTNPPRDKLGPGGDEDSDRSCSSHHRDWGPSADLLPGEELGRRSSWSRSASRNTLSSHSQGERFKLSQDRCVTFH